MASEYILSGRLKAAEQFNPDHGSTVELLVWLDSEAEKLRLEIFARIQRQYSLEIRTNGCEVEWRPQAAISLSRIAHRGHPLFTLDGVKVFEINSREADQAIEQK